MSFESTDLRFIYERRLHFFLHSTPTEVITFLSVIYYYKGKLVIWFTITVVDSLGAC